MGGDWAGALGVQMKNTGQRSSTTRTRRNAALAFLLAAALMLSHEVYGAYHQVHQISTSIQHSKVSKVREPAPSSLMSKVLS
jgi:glutaminase